MAPIMETAVSKSQTQSPYRLDTPQVLKASNALVGHIRSEAKRKDAVATKKNLLADADDDVDAPDAEPIWLIVTTKKHILDQKRLKPGKISIPHTLNRAATSICVITPDPQRQFKDVVDHPSFPASLKPQLRILGISKLKQRTKSFQERRKLLSEHDIFMADDRVVTMLPNALGKVFYQGASAKRPVPVRLQGYKSKEDGKKAKTAADSDTKSALKPVDFAKEIEKAMSTAYVHLSPSVTTAIHIGFSNFSPQQITENIQAVVDGMVEKYITKGWRNVKTIHLKGPNTVAFPLWMADELWVEEEDVIDDAAAEEAKRIGSQKGTKRKGRELEEGEESAKKPKTKLLSEEGFDKDMAERRAKLREDKRKARDEAEREETEVTTTAVVEKVGVPKKVKMKKGKIIETAA